MQIEQQEYNIFSLPEKTSEPKLCSTHHLGCIGIDINPICDAKSRHCCQQCLNSFKKSREFITYQNAYFELSNNKAKFFTKANEQQKLNSKLLSNFLQEIEKFKKQIIGDLDSLGAEIKQLIFVAENYLIQNQDNCKNIDIDTYVQENIVFNQKQKYQKIIECVKDRLRKIFAESNQNQLFSSLDQLELSPIQLEKLTYKGQQEPTLRFLCQKHNNQIKLFDLNQSTKPEARFLCEECLDDQENNLRAYTSIQRVYAKWQNYVDWNLDKIGKFTEHTSKINKIVEILSAFNTQLKNEIASSATIAETLKNNLLEKHQIQTKDLMKSWDQLTEEEVQQRAETLSGGQEWVKQMEKSYNYQWNGLKTQINDQFFKTINKIKIWCHQRISSISAIIEKENQNQYIQTVYYPKANYENIASYKQKDKPYTIIINQTQDIIVCGFYLKIIIFQFINGQIQEKESLSFQNGTITALCFCQNDQFVSASSDYSLRLWTTKTSDITRNPITIYETKKLDIRFLLWDQNHKLIISCFESFIIFRNKNLQQLSILDLNYSSIQNLYLNDQQDKLICCNNTGYFQMQGYVTIAIYEGNQYVIKQNISLNEKVRRMGVFRNESYLFLQYKEGISLEVYKQGQNNYYKVQTLIIGKEELEDDENYFFSVFNTKRHKLLCKHNQEVCIISKTQDDVFYVDQRLNFGTMEIQVLFLEDGDHFITWDDKSKELKIWKQK